MKIFLSLQGNFRWAVPTWACLTFEDFEYFLVCFGLSLNSTPFSHGHHWSTIPRPGRMGKISFSFDFQPHAQVKGKLESGQGISLGWERQPKNIFWVCFHSCGAQGPEHPSPWSLLPRLDVSSWKHRDYLGNALFFQTSLSSPV